MISSMLGNGYLILKTLILNIHISYTRLRGMEGRVQMKVLKMMSDEYRYMNIPRLLNEITRLNISRINQYVVNFNDITKMTKLFIPKGTDMGDSIMLLVNHFTLLSEIRYI